MEENTQPLNIRLLGTPERLHRGIPLRFRSRKIVALFIYLIVTQENHSRDKLITLLWPESDQTRGRTSLCTAITRLRQSLKDTAVTLITEGDSIRIDPDAPLNLDLNGIETGLLTGETSQNQMPRGPFLEGFSIAGAPAFDD